MFRRIVLPIIVLAVYWLLSLSWRKKFHYHPEVVEMMNAKKSFILAHWHGDELGLLFLFSKLPISTMTSTSKDGILMDFVVRKLGGKTTRGSSTRGGVGALKGLIKMIKNEGRNGSMAVDGPRGPIHQVKPGVFELSRLTNTPIVPVSFSCNRKHIFERSWNKAQLPLPFSKVELVFGKPMPAISREQSPKEIKLANKLREMLFDARQQASNLIASL